MSTIEKILNLITIFYLSTIKCELRAKFDN